MTFYNHQSYLLGISCIALILVSGLVATSSFETQFQKKCLIGTPGQYCCIEGCSDNCDKDCKENGYNIGSFCDTIGIGNLCCCVTE
ncbi:hypothetical protein P8452_19135 [Trifolium repens]|nr:hypothetical protein P8452_19135 [Trifolium repens]